MKKIISFLLVFILIASIPMMTIAAKSQTELQNELNNNKTEKENVEKEKEAVKKELSAAMQEVSTLTSQIKEYESEISSLNTQIANLEEDLKEAEKDIEIAQEKCDEQDEMMKRRLIAIYESGTYSYLDVLLHSTSLADFISNYYLITEVAEKDSELLENLENSKKELEIAKKKIEDDKQNIENAKQTKVAKSNALETAKAAKAEQVSKLSSEEKELQSKIDEYEKNVADLEAQIRKAEAEAAAKAAADAKKSSGSGSSGSTTGTSSSYNGSGMIWPTPGCKYITSPYGYRYHPVYGYSSFHTGIDIGASNRSNVVAAQSGVVTLAAYNGGYGNCVMISHGGGISTLYAHGSQILVKNGQSVKQGDVIMLVGSTGVSTGPHLHFEVRVNGSHTQPLNYLP